MSGASVSLVDGQAAIRVAEAVLRAAGGRMVQLRLSAAAKAGSDAEQLGLAVPRFQDALVGPAAFRSVGSEKVLLVSARSLQGTLRAVGAVSVEMLLETATGVVIDGELFPIAKSVAMGSAGAAFCYAVTLLAAVM